jgi:hypothetical protein
MGDGQDRQDAAEGASVPGGESPLQPIAPQPDLAATEGSVPKALFPEDASLTGAIASLEAPEAPSPVPGSEATAVEPVPTAAADAPDASHATTTDSESAALQADLAAAGENHPTEAIPAVAVVPDAETESAPPQPAAADVGAETETDVDTSESFDDIVPGNVIGEQAAIEDAKDLALPADRPGVPIWPFVVYFAAWVVFAGLLVWQFMQTPAGMPLYELTIYGPSILVGLVLTVMGPLVAIAVWLVVWLTRPGARSGLFSRCLILGAVATLGGVAVWLVALGAVDMLRLGRLL